MDDDEEDIVVRAITTSDGTRTVAPNPPEQPTKDDVLGLGYVDSSSSSSGSDDSSPEAAATNGNPTRGKGGLKRRRVQFSREAVERDEKRTRGTRAALAAPARTKPAVASTPEQALEDDMARFRDAIGLGSGDAALREGEDAREAALQADLHARVATLRAALRGRKGTSS